jgi:hypothetical protein
MSTVSGLEIANQIEREWRDRLEAAVKEEREACAKCAEDVLTRGRSPLGRVVAEAIRARSSNAS